MLSAIPSKNGVLWSQKSQDSGRHNAKLKSSKSCAKHTEVYQLSSSKISINLQDVVGRGGLNLSHPELVLAAMDIIMAAKHILCNRGAAYTHDGDCSLENRTVRVNNVQCFIILNVKTNFRRKLIFIENMKKLTLK